MSAGGVAPSPSAAPPSAAPAAPAAPSLAARLRDVRVGARRDLEVTRHRFRGEIAYVLRDPLTMAHHRVGLREYAILVELDESRPLGDLFAELVRTDRLRADGEEGFYRFVYSLHRLGFLALPLNDEQALYRRAEQERAARRQRALRSAFLSVQIPLWNPDRFLQRTLPWVRPLFSRVGAALWAAVVLLGGWVIAANFREFSEPIVDLLDGRNLPALWTTLIVLKVAHEFGHAYACRHFGGHVPQMGLNLILFTPTAYVDATASWSFTDRWQRIVVCLGGMIVELFFAAIAAFVWAVTPPGPLHSVAHGVVVMASLMTLAFNLNPFLKYDGYHALCDLLELPNLRARAEEYALAWLRKVLLGTPIERPPAERRLRWFFLAFAAGCVVAQVGLVAGMCLAIARQYYVVGVVLGVGYLVSRCFGLVRTVVGGMLRSASSALARRRAIAAGVLLLGVVPLAVMAVPLPPCIAVAGVAGRLVEAEVCATADGILDELPIAAGARIEAGTTVACLLDPSAETAIAEARARVEQAQLLVRAAPAEEVSARQEAEERLAQANDALRHASERAAARTVRAPIGGQLVRIAPPTDRGRFLHRGDPLGLVVDGSTCVRALLSEEEWARCQPRPGDRAEFRATVGPRTLWPGVVERVASVSTREFPARFAALADVNGGDIAMNPVTGAAGQPLFEVIVRLEAATLPVGSSGVLRLAAPTARVGGEAWRRLVRFGQRLRDQE